MRQEPYSASSGAAPTSPPRITSQRGTAKGREKREPGPRHLISRNQEFAHSRSRGSGIKEKRRKKGERISGRALFMTQDLTPWQVSLHLVLMHFRHGSWKHVESNGLQ